MPLPTGGGAGGAGPARADAIGARPDRLAAMRPLPDFEAFSDRAQALTREIPAEFLAGIESVDVHRERKTHPLLPDVVTLGECATSPLSSLVGEEAFRSTVHLYYGSFVDLARRDPAFDLDAELRETIEHEIQHHVEDRAGVRALHDEDALFDAHARFRAGLDVPAGWYRQGEALEPGVWAVDLDLFVELDVPRAEFERLRGRTLVLDVLGEPLELELPADADPEEVFTVEGAGLLEEEDGEGGSEDDDTEGGDAGAPGLCGDLHLVPRVR